jgi:hypothetical protein
MSEEQWTPKPYQEQELLSFDRLKRAVMSRTLDKAEFLMEEEFPLSPERQDEVVKEEWKRAKDAVKASPAAKEAYRKYLEGRVGDQIDVLIKSDKTELGAMGVKEKSI